MQHYILAESFETSVEWSRVLDLCDRVKSRIRREHAHRGLPGKPLIMCRITQTYQTGVAAYFYFAYYFEGVSEPAKVYSEIERAARDEILLAGGSLSHHHGVGNLRKDFLTRAWSPTAMAWRQAVKRAADPDNVFGCGNSITI
jgi:alkyldihydroxyacetonephosphate synthase